MVITPEGEKYVWWANQKGKVVEGEKVKGLMTVTGFTKSQKLSWMNNLIIAIDSEFEPVTKEFKGVAHQWK